MRGATLLYTSIFILVVLSAGLAIWVYYLKEGKDLLNFTIFIVGFCIAVLALFIAVRTYTSIDSVNNISKMEGNILDNEHYVTSLPELINHYQAKDEKTLENALFESMESKLKYESDTAVMFADTLQYLIDLIVLFPAVFNASDTDKGRYKKRMDKILLTIDKQRDALHAVSKGNAIQITESIKLFKAVVAYQRFVADGDFNIHADLLHVRGPILRNPVTRTIYHNYLGLYYNKKGMHLIRDGLNMGNTDILSLEGLDFVNSKADELRPSVKEDTILYLNTACEHFDRALSISSEDVMWPGFINFNKARTLYFLHVLEQKDTPWLNVMDNAIAARSRLNRLIDEILSPGGGNKDATVKATHLREFFQFQEEMARLVKLNLLLVQTNGEEELAAIRYKGTALSETTSDKLDTLFTDCKTFAVVTGYQASIKDWLNQKNAIA
ncbi:hypothetical protein [Alteromonas sp. CYL-A6]|uniref:hypothetical protein n=1 Tax=Alteromonas nitratireducens TaxID=3390813 RepID=UPI0034BA5ACF